VIVWYPRFEYARGLDICGDVLDEDFGPSTREEVLLVWVELDRTDRDPAVDLGGGDTALACSQIVHRRRPVHDLYRVPKSDGTVDHTSRENTGLTLMIDPVKRCECCWGFGYTLKDETSWAIDVVFRNPQEGVRLSTAS